jgi:hypothetical protein
MTFARDLTTLLVAVLAIASATPGQAATQFAPDSDAAQLAPEPEAAVQPAAIPASLEQRIMAQLGIGQGFMQRMLQSQLNILDTQNRGRVGTCRQLGDGSSIQLKSSTGTFVTKAVVEIYFDSRCKDVFIHSMLTVRPKSFTSVSLTETATFRRPTGTTAGTLTFAATGSETSNTVRFAGTGSWAPSGGGANTEVGLKCDYPLKLSGAKPFPCSFGIVQPVKAFNADLAVAATLKFKVNAVAGGFDGAFTGAAQLSSGPLGTLGVSAPNSGPVTISGPDKSIGTSSISGSARLTVFAPPPCSWSVSNGRQTLAVQMAKGLTQNSAGTIKDAANKTLATFSVDKSGEGTITYSDRQRAKITNWLIAN